MNKLNVDKLFLTKKTEILKYLKINYLHLKS